MSTKTVSLPISYFNAEIALWDALAAAAVVSPKVRSAVMKAMMGRSEELEAAGSVGKSDCLSVLIAGFVLIWQYLF